MQSILIVVILGFLYSVSAKPTYNIEEELVSVGRQCSEEHPELKKEIKILKNITLDRNALDNEAARCLLTCAFKKFGVIDDEGKFNPAGLRNFSSKYDLGDVENYIKTCLKVNNEPVRDGNKGCDRTVMLYKCEYDNFNDDGGFLAKFQPRT